MYVLEGSRIKETINKYDMTRAQSLDSGISLKEEEWSWSGISSSSGELVPIPFVESLLLLLLLFLSSCFHVFPFDKAILSMLKLTLVKSAMVFKLTRWRFFMYKFTTHFIEGTIFSIIKEMTFSYSSFTLMHINVLL